VAEVALIPNPITRAGVVPTSNESLSASETYTVVNEGNVVLRVSNGATAITKVTVTTQAEVDEQKVTSREVEVAKSTVKYIGPFLPSIYDKKGSFQFKISSATEVKIEVVQF